MANKIKSFFIAMLYLGIAFVIQITVSIIGATIISVKYFMENPSKAQISVVDQTTAITKELMANMNYILLISSILTIVIFFLIYILKKKNISKELLFKNTNKSNYLLALMLGVSIWLFNMGFVSLLSEAGLFKNSFKALEDAMSFIGVNNVVLSILVVGIVAPFSEELIFRGVIYNKLSKSMSITATIIIQGILFGVYHMNLVQGLYASLLGIVFGYVTYKTKSIWPAVIMHMVNNAVSVIAPYILGESIDSLFAYIILLIIGFIISGIGIVLIRKYNLNVLDNNDELNNNDELVES